jgi:hypothetical protein
VWGAQQNRLVDSQLESARQSELSVEHEHRVQSFGDSAQSESRTDSENLSESVDSDH